MAFTGTPNIAVPTRSVVQITGLSLAASASGTISLSQGGGDVALPASIQWSPYGGEDDDVGVGADIIDLAESVEVSITQSGMIATSSQKLNVTKANGLDPATFAITIANVDVVNATGNLEIRLRYH